MAVSISNALRSVFTDHLIATECLICLILSSIGLSTTASSSLSSGELLETPPRAPSSPSAASLQLKPEPLAVEMGGKCSSAPLLENNDAEKANGKVPVSTILQLLTILLVKCP